MSIQSNFPALKPSLLLDFSNTEALDSRVTFTRASTATYYGTQTAKAEENLFTFSAEIDNAAWVKIRGSVSANSTTAPDGTSTADKFVEDTTASNTHFIFQSFTSISAAYTVSFFAKAGERTWCYLSIETTSDAAFFDLANGVTGSVSSGITSSITSVGDGWYRCTATKTVGGSNEFPGIGIAIANNDRTYTGDGTSGIFIWGAQLEQRSAVTAYTPTTTQPITNYIPVLQTAASGVARFDHNPTTFESLGLLIEEQRTNLLTYSEDFASGDDFGVTFAAAVNPSGTINNCKVIVNSGETFPTTSTRAARLSSAVGNTDTASVFAKAGEYDSIRLEAVADNNSGRFVRAVFNLSNGTVTTSQGGDATWFSGFSTTINEVGNGWYRCSITFKVEPSTSFARPYWQPADSVATTGDGYSGVFMWGAQLEAGAFPTSYIPTVASQVTRSADAASMTGANFSSWYRADNGSVMVEFNTFATASTNVIQIGSSSSSSQVSLYRDFSTWRYRTNLANLNLINFTSSYNKAAFVYGSSDYVISVNGKAVQTNTGVGLVPAAEQILIGGGNAYAASLPLNGTIKKLAFYPRRISNAELQALTQN
jgi:hypothetical protein